jgi:hypothetical protein
MKQTKTTENAAIAASIRKAFAFPPIDNETRSHVDTARAAFYLSRKPQTLRMWACFENGPLRPTRVNGRLAWSVAKIRALLSGVDNG